MSTRKTIDSAQAREMGARIRGIRGKRSQAEFAEDLEIDRATLANYEAGRRIPNNDVIKTIANIAGMSAQELIFGSRNVSIKERLKYIDEEISEKMRARPGIIPKFSISDDEMALIIVVRLAISAGDALEPLRHLVESAEEALKEARRNTREPYGENYVKRMWQALRRGSIDEGYDPEAALLALVPDAAPAERDD